MLSRVLPKEVDLVDVARMEVQIAVGAVVDALGAVTYVCGVKVTKSKETRCHHRCLMEQHLRWLAVAVVTGQRQCYRNRTSEL